MVIFFCWEPKEVSGVRGRWHRGGALEVGRFLLGGLVQIAIMNPMPSGMASKILRAKRGRVEADAKVRR